MSESSNTNGSSSFGGGIKLSVGQKVKKLDRRTDKSHFEIPEEDVSGKSGKVAEEFLLEIEGDNLRGTGPSKSNGPLVIPLLKQNVWRNASSGISTPSASNGSRSSTPQKRDRSPSPMRTTSTASLRAASPREKTPGPTDSAARGPSPPPTLKWGLQIRKKQKTDTPASSAPSTPAPPSEDVSMEEEKVLSLEDQAIADLLAEAAGVADSQRTELAPILAQNAVPGLDELMSDQEKYRHDISMRPEEATLDDYERIPIEEFGSALLRGMGWEKGKAVGRNGNGLIEPIINKPRPHLLGLGAKPAPDLEKKEKKYIKPGEKRDPGYVRDLAASDKRSNRTDDYDNRPRSKPSSAKSSPAPFKSTAPTTSVKVGSIVQITNGSHKGKEGKVMEIKERSSGTVVKVDVDGEVVRIWEDQVTAAEKANGSSKSSGGGNRRSWLIPNIRLRIVSKSFKNGRYYNQKCIVQDVVAAGECIVKTEEGDLVEGVQERHVETYIPATGKTVVVVQSPDAEVRGHTGRIKEKNNEQERAVVEMDHDFEYHTFTYDQITEHADPH
ncbi:hypothetical protein HK097_007697 [Rhizophlyctis rosea]|uniref:G-patch domain-containing protein n=1 Tax=Rhizophlyctis rosea TaxID=64517 RepID=A0AAD5SK77_9FUNG|nr:hypothetical protein HK097_007697 [Rhizophlyctis rosea]